MRTLLQDIRYAARMLMKAPGFTAVAVLSLALGIGANTAIFSVLRAVVLNQLPYRQPERLVAIAGSDPATTNAITVDFTTTHDWRERSHSFESMSLYRYWAAALVEQETPEVVQAMRVGYDFFDTLGVKVALGRTFRPEEDRPDRWHVLILSHGLWVRRFGADPKVVGRNVRINEMSFTIVGILPPEFRSFRLANTQDAPQMYAPLGYALGQPDACRGCQHLRLVARLKTDVSVGAASAELNTIMTTLLREFPDSYAKDAGVLVTSLRDHLLGQVSTALWVLLGAVGFVLLIACANVSNLLLARATGRAREIAVRAALGAGRRRLVRHLLTESLVLAMAGGVAGVFLAAWGTSLLVSIGPRDIPRMQEISLDLPVLLFGLAASLVTGILCGLAPALLASQVDLSESLKEAAKSTEGGSRHGLRSLLAVSELALAFVLVMGAGLLAKSFMRLMNVDAGFDPHNVLTLNSYLYGSRYKTPEVERGYYDQVIERLRAIPGVESAAMVSTLPLGGFDRRGLQIQERPEVLPPNAPSADTYSVTSDYFRVMRIPIKRGRGFSIQDGPDAPHVALISESCARAVFPSEDPIGKHIQLGGRHDDKPWATVVGIVGDIRQYGLDRPSSMEAYLPLAQNQDFSFNMVIRTTADPQSLESAVRDVFYAVDKTQPIFNLESMESLLGETLAQRAFTLYLLGLFSALAIVLAAVGIYGIISYTVSLRTREVGIRMALGARQRDVLTMVMQQGLALAGVGLALGFVASLTLTRFLSSLLYEVKPTDLATSTAVAALISAVALLAGYLPARRATRVDPMVALRHE